MSGFLDAIGANKPRRHHLAVVAKTTDIATPFGRAVLDKRCAELMNTVQGMREATLHKFAILVGGYVAGGEIPYDLAFDDLYAAAQISGLPDGEIDGKLARHLETGMAAPLAAPERWTAGDPVPEVARRTTMQDRMLSRSGLRNLPTPTPMITGVLNGGTTALLYGRWGTAKSFVALDWACCLSTGKRWQGCDVKRTKTLYVAAEGAYGYRARVDAWEAGWKTDIDDEYFAVYPEPVNLSNVLAVDELCALVGDEGFGFIVLDTLARCTVGADENSARDVGLVIDALSRIRDATPQKLGTALGVHHTGKDGLTLRGSSSYEGGVDSVFQIVRGDGIKMTCTKQKDMTDGQVWRLKLTPWPGTSSCIIENGEHDVEEPSAKDLILSALAAREFARVSTTELQEALCYRTGDEDRAGRVHQKYLFQCLRELQDSGAIVKIATKGSQPEYQLASSSGKG